MHKSVVIMGVVLLAVSGCAMLKQAHQDYELGRTTPLTHEEVAPRQAAENLVEPLKPFIPVPFQPVAGIVVTTLAVVGTWLRGRRIRKQQPTVTNPITGEWGQRLGIETVLQHLANMVTGITEVGRDGSGLKRGWKVGLVVFAGLLATVTTIPAAKEFFSLHPAIGTVLVGFSALLAGVEKEISKVGQPSAP